MLTRSVGYYKDFEEPRYDEEWDDTYDIGEDVIEFKANGTFIMSIDNEETDYGKWKLNGNNLTVIWPANEYNDEHTEKIKIVSLTATELVMEYHYENQYEKEYSKLYYQRMN